MAVFLATIVDCRERLMHYLLLANVSRKYGCDNVCYRSVSQTRIDIILNNSFRKIS